MKYFIAILVTANITVAAWNLYQPAIPATTYVLTPLVDIIPEGPGLSPAETESLLQELRHQPEARDMQKAYARMGSTLSLHDLLRGIGQLDMSDSPLSKRQDKSLEGLLQQALERHKRLRDVQNKILEVERSLDQQLKEIKQLENPL
jgi:hypothetical protein